MARSAALVTSTRYRQGRAVGPGGDELLPVGESLGPAARLVDETLPPEGDAFRCRRAYGFFRFLSFERSYSVFM